MNNDLISREALKKEVENLHSIYTKDKEWFYTLILVAIDNAPTVEVPENKVNCVLTMFGECSYNETGCGGCEIKDKIRKALSQRPQGEWVVFYTPKKKKVFKCDKCMAVSIQGQTNFCHSCGARMQKGGTE